ncbi:MAG: HAD hydrolase-like protein [Rickettsiales bacterium]|jgi:phosphoglycolate phosphatase|nr:HAD hydrolase-like protein [Rickettsiales bacterium]
MIPNLRQNTPNAIIFDWDNTLANTWPLIEKAMFQMLQEYNMEPYLDEYRKRTFGMPMRQSFPLLFKDKADEMLQCYVKYYHQVRKDNLCLNPYAEDLINSAKNKDIPLFIVSNKLGESLRYEVESLNYNNSFAAIIGSKDTEYDKPHKYPVEHAIKNHNITLDQKIWFIGDSEVDMNCALNCNCLGILYGDSYKKTTRVIPESNQIHKISSFNELL